MFKDEKTKKRLIIAGIAFLVIYLLLFLVIQAGITFDRFGELARTTLSVLSPIVIGAVIAYLLNPLLRFMEKKVLKKISRPKLKRLLSVILVYILVILLLIGFLSTVTTQLLQSIQTFASNLGNYSNALQTMISDWLDDINAFLEANPSIDNLLHSAGIYDIIGKVIIEENPDSLPPLNGDLQNPPPTESDTQPESPDEFNSSETAPVSSESGSPDQSSESASDSGNASWETQKYVISFDAIAEYLLKQLSELTASFGQLVGRLSSSILSASMSFVSFLKNAILGIFISIYFLCSKERIGAQARKVANAVFPEKVYKELSRFGKYTDRTVGRYIIGTCIDSFFVGCITFILLSIFKINYALIIAVIVGVTNVIPFFGPIIGAVPSALIVLLDDITVLVNAPDEPHHFKVITFLILILVIQQIEGNLLAPHIHGNSTGLSSLGVILAITIMGGYFGFVGMLLGVPIAAVVVKFMQELTEKRLVKKELPVELAAYYAPGGTVPPDEPEDESEGARHTRFYNWIGENLEKLRRFFRRLLYRKNEKPLKIWVSMKLGRRKVKHSMQQHISAYRIQKEQKKVERAQSKELKAKKDREKYRHAAKKSDETASPSSNETNTDGTKSE